MLRSIGIPAIVALGLLFPAQAAIANQFSGGDAERILGEIRTAWSAGDSQRVADLIEFAPAVENDSRGGLERAQELCSTDRGRQFAVMLQGLAFRSMDRYVCAPSRNCGSPSDGVRVIFEKSLPAELASRPAGPRLEVWSFIFVHREGHWKWYWRGGIVPWHPWDYKVDTAESTYVAVLQAQDSRDYLTIHEIIEPGLLPSGMSLDSWLQAVAGRVAAMDQDEEQENADRKLAETERRPMPKRRTPPFVAIGQCGYKAETHYVDEGRTIAQVSHLWDQAEKLKGPVPYEIFVKRGDRWYWQPKPEYTLWPLATNGPTSTQPAAEAPKQ
jgi:hypothetical protein